MRGSIFYTVGIACAGGIFMGSFFDFGWASIILPVVIGIAFFVAKSLVKQKSLSLFFILGTACVSFAAGAARLEKSEMYVSPLGQYENKKVSIEGKIIREPEIRETVIHLYVEPVNVEKLDEYVLVTADRSAFRGDLMHGDQVAVRGTLKKPEEFETETGRMFDYASFLKAKNVHYVMNFAEVRKVKESDSILSNLYQGKQAFIEAIERNIKEPHSGLGEGILLGVKSVLGERLEKSFRETGIIHIVVLSGYNVMIVVETMLYLLAFVFCPRTRLLIGLVAIGLFALLVGFSATVVRASIMAALLLVARTTGRTYAVLRALMLAGIAMLFINPYLLVHDPGFQLSFLATLGLILFSPYMEKKLTRIPEAFGMRKIMTATLSTQLCVLPLLLYQTGLFSAVSILVNLLALPAVPFAMLFTFLTGFTGLLIPAFGKLFGFIAYLLLEYIMRIAEFFGGLPIASFNVAAFPFWIVVLAYACLGYLLWLLARKENEYAEFDVFQANDDYTDWTLETLEAKTPDAASVPRSFPFR
jgi:competence protein ComEC